MNACCHYTICWPCHYLPWFSDSRDSCQPRECRGVGMEKWLGVWGCLLNLLGRCEKTFRFPFLAVILAGLNSQFLLCLFCFWEVKLELGMWYSWLHLIRFLCIYFFHLVTSSSGWEIEGRSVPLGSSVTRNLSLHIWVCAHACVCVSWRFLEPQRIIGELLWGILALLVWVKVCHCASWVFFDVLLVLFRLH